MKPTVLQSHPHAYKDAHTERDQGDLDKQNSTIEPSIGVRWAAPLCPVTIH